jgi:hypothetical protein
LGDGAHSGDDPDEVPDESRIRTTVRDLPGYYREGHGALLDSLRRTPADLAAMIFLNDAPAPREFWARPTIGWTWPVEPRRRDPARRPAGRAGSLAVDSAGALELSPARYPLSIFHK